MASHGIWQEPIFLMERGRSVTYCNDIFTKERICACSKVVVIIGEMMSCSRIKQPAARRRICKTISNIC